MLDQKAIDKKGLRKNFLTQRRGLSPEEWQGRSQTIVRTLLNCPRVQEANRIFAYFSIHQEPDLSLLFQLNQIQLNQIQLNPVQVNKVQVNKVWGFPVIQGQDLIWYPWQPGEPLVKGAYGIPVPAVQAQPLPLEGTDLILVPGVAMDRRGYRLGYGGGFYDRLLASAEGQQIPTIGIVFEFALVPTLPQEAWDRQLGGWCTEKSASW